MHCFPLFLRRKVPATRTGILYMVPNKIIDIPIDTSHALNTHEMWSVFLGRKSPATHTGVFIYIYIYIYGTKRIMEMPICTSHVLNTHALLSAVFR